MSNLLAEYTQLKAIVAHRTGIAFLQTRISVSLLPLTRVEPSLLIATLLTESE